MSSYNDLVKEVDDHERRIAKLEMYMKANGPGAAETPAVSPDEPPIPANWVRIRPTGPRGAGIYRDWPNPEFVSGYDGLRVSTITGYQTSAWSAWHCPYSDPAKYPLLGGAAERYIEAAGYGTRGAAAFPEALDRYAFPEQWMTAEELAKAAADLAQQQKGSDPLISGGTTSGTV